MVRTPPGTCHPRQQKGRVAQQYRHERVVRRGLPGDHLSAHQLAQAQSHGERTAPPRDRVADRRDGQHLLSASASWKRLQLQHERPRSTRRRPGVWLTCKAILPQRKMPLPLLSTPARSRVRRRSPQHKPRERRRLPRSTSRPRRPEQPLAPEDVAHGTTSPSAAHLTPTDRPSNTAGQMTCPLRSARRAVRRLPERRTEGCRREVPSESRPTVSSRWRQKRPTAAPLPSLSSSTNRQPHPEPPKRSRTEPASTARRGAYPLEGQCRQPERTRREEDASRKQGDPVSNCRRR